MNDGEDLEGYEYVFSTGEITLWVDRKILEISEDNHKENKNRYGRPCRYSQQISPTQLPKKKKTSQ